MRKHLDISVLIPVYNAATTIEKALLSLKKQSYPVKEIVLIDNYSTDHSLELIKKFKKQNKGLKIRIVEQKENKGLVKSYNLGVRMAKSKYAVFMHSDSELPTTKEMEKLVSPFVQDPEVLTTYPKVLHPEKVWQQYNFWQKLQFAQVVGRESSGLNGKFDCFKRKILLKIKDDWQETFANTDKAGGEDWYLYARLKKEGKVIATEAKVTHLHYLSASFTLSDFIKKRKHVSRSYGKLLKLFGFSLGLKGVGAFTFRPLLAIATFIPPVNSLVFPLLIVFSVVYTKKMFFNRQTLFNFRIFLLPFINIFLVYYESFWTIESLLSTRK